MLLVMLLMLAMMAVESRMTVTILNMMNMMTVPVPRVLSYMLCKSLLKLVKGSGEV